MDHPPNGFLAPQGGGSPIPLTRVELTLGRDDRCDVPIRFPNVSNQHAKLRFQNGLWYIHDLGSTNGTRVNGERIVEALLRPGDEIAISRHRFRIDYFFPGDDRPGSAGR